MQQKKLFSAFSLSRYIKFSKGGEIWGYHGGQGTKLGFMMGSGSITTDIYFLEGSGFPTKKSDRKIDLFFFFF
jgi:hypothetical protein